MLFCVPYSTVAAADENVGAFFDFLHNVVKAFSSVGFLLENMWNLTQMSFHLRLIAIGHHNNLKIIMMKSYSFLASFKLI